MVQFQSSPWKKGGPRKQISRGSLLTLLPSRMDPKEKLARNRQHEVEVHCDETSRNGYGEFHCAEEHNWNKAGFFRLVTFKMCRLLNAGWGILETWSSHILKGAKFEKTLEDAVGSLYHRMALWLLGDPAICHNNDLLYRMALETIRTQVMKIP